MKKLIYLFVAAMLVSGCAINAPSYRSVESKGSSQGMIVVEYFDMKNAENAYKGKSDFSKLIAEYIAGSLQERNYQVITMERQSSQSPAKYLIRGKINKINPGNWKGRFWVGPGVGMARVTAEAVLIRVSDNTELASAKKTISSSTCQGAESILRRICAKVSRGIANEFCNALRNDKK